MQSISLLMDSIVDYAGLFPPAELPLHDVVSNYDRFRQGDHDWMLGRLVLPVKLLDQFEAEAEAMLQAGDGLVDAWVISALIGTAGTEQCEADLERITRFNQEHSDPAKGAAIVDSIELRLDDASVLEGLVENLDETIYPYLEVDTSRDCRGLIASMADLDVAAKIRTGGIQASAHPSVEDVAVFLEATHAAGVPFKATAGLHHPLRHHAPSVDTKQYGFINIFLSACMLFADKVDPDQLRQLLAEESWESLSVSEEAIGWNSLAVDLEDIIEARECYCHSFGCCSFDDPINDLTALNLLHEHDEETTT